MRTELVVVDHRQEEELVADMLADNLVGMVLERKFEAAPKRFDCKKPGMR